jgi:hypothetical protein
MVPAGPFGVNLNPVLIAHDAKIQRYIDDLHLSWGVQYELARGISIATWGWSDITLEKLTQLKGSNTEAAHKVSTVMIGEPRENNATFPEVSIW